jgi:hypothetical protein
MKRLTLAVAILGLCFLSASNLNSQENAQEPNARKSPTRELSASPYATDACSYNFTSGSNNTFLQYCVTENGNIISLVTPVGQVEIANDTEGEGYGFCDVTAGNVAYSDYGVFGTTSNWDIATVVSHSATAIKFARQTNDLIWTLTQTITQEPATASIRVVMALKNNTAVARTVNILRYADVDADDDPSNNLDGTHNSAMAWTSTSATNGFGLMLQNVGTPTFTYDGFVQNNAEAPNPCAYSVNFNPGVLTHIDGSIVMVYVGTVPARGTKTFTMMYKGL